ncbi:hypothetical protein HK104_001054 [Borealophlyctis nickersoniae]|nr:hypothetical protein HK104_001054 [Borealophlyctis nickersoniae]
MPNRTEGIGPVVHTKKRRGRKLPAEPGPTEEVQLPPAPEIFALNFKYLNGSARTLLTLRQACHTTKFLAERDILAYALEHCRPTLSVTFPSSETRFCETAYVTKDTTTGTLEGIVIECLADTPFRYNIHTLWRVCDELGRLESGLEKMQDELEELAEKKGVGNVAELVIETTTVVNVMRETLSGFWKDEREGGGEEDQLVAGGGVVDMASMLKAAQTELNALKGKFRKESLWSRYGEKFELWVDAIGSWIRTLMVTPDSVTAKGFFEASEVRQQQTAATWMQYAEELKMAAARAAGSHKVLEASLELRMDELNVEKAFLSLLFAVYGPQLGVHGGVFKNTGKFRVGARAAPRITVATGGKTIVQAPGTLIPKSTFPLFEMDTSLVKISLGGLHTGKTSRRGKVAGTVFGLGVLRGDELELLSIRIHTDVVGLCFMKCL